MDCNTWLWMVYPVIEIKYCGVSISAVVLGYILLQILAYLLKKKAHLLNSRILHLVLSIGGPSEAGLEQPTIKNVEIFQHIVCNFQVMMLLFVCLFVYWQQGLSNLGGL